MWAGGAISVLLVFARLYIKVCIDSALKKRDEQLEIIKDDLGQTNNRIVGYMHQMFAQINSLTPGKKDD